ncbi:MAG TPA: hypothetical protein EYH01_02505 [Campylobacterales bacterium]|nr:hypothetical protein [Campylobacterales bacterium]
MKTIKQKQFNLAMKSYNSSNRYKHIYKIVSTLNVSMQIILLFILFSLTMPWYLYLIGFFIAYFLTDFINGLVHMYMDNNDNYNSIWGPFIASFHLHHKTEKYKEANIFLLYFNESGAKFWLVPYLIIVLLLSTMAINPFVLLLLIYIGILSSFSEISHYLCHNADSNFITTLQKYRILLPISHHAKHHQYDNQSYAFLNGTSDFIIDKIAKKLYTGYKNGSDEHFKTYDGAGTDNRD